MAYSQEEFAKAGFNGQMICAPSKEDDSHYHQANHHYLHIPYLLDGGDMCVLGPHMNPRDYQDMMSRTATLEERGDYRKSLKINRELTGVAQGAAIVGAGLLVARNSNHELTRRKFITKAIEGSVYGVFTKVITNLIPK